MSYMPLDWACTSRIIGDYSFSLRLGFVISKKNLIVAR